MGLVHQGRRKAPDTPGGCAFCGLGAGRSAPQVYGPSFAVGYYARARALGGMNGGNARTTGLDRRPEEYSAPRQSQSSMSFHWKNPPRDKMQIEREVRGEAEGRRGMAVSLVSSPCAWFRYPSACVRGTLYPPAGTASRRAGQGWAVPWRFLKADATSMGPLAGARAHSPPPALTSSLLGTLRRKEGLSTE